MATIAALGALYGRKVKTESGGRTNIYCVGIGETGCGKDNARQCVKRLFLSQPDTEQLIGPESFTSDSALISSLAESPSQIAQIDEMGRFFKSIANPEKSPHMYQLVTEMMKLYTSANSAYMSKGFADAKQNRKINEPNFCIYGTTTPNAFTDSLTMDNVSDGFLGRTLIMWSSMGAQRPRKNVTEAPIPASIAAHLKDWGILNGQTIDGSAQIIRHTNAAEIVKNEFIDTVHDATESDKKEHGELGHLWGRVGQKVDQLALIFACAKYTRDSVVIDDECMKSSVAIVSYITRKMIYELSGSISENETQKSMMRITKIVSKFGKAGCSRTQLCRRLQWVVGHKRDALISALIDDGSIVEDVQMGKTKPITKYTAV